MGKQEAYSIEVRALTPVFEKSIKELKHKQRFLKCKSTIPIVTSNVRTLNGIDKLQELTVSALEHNVNIECVQ